MLGNLAILSGHKAEKTFKSLEPVLQVVVRVTIDAALSEVWTTNV